MVMDRSPKILDKNTEDDLHSKVNMSDINELIQQYKQQKPKAEPDGISNYDVKYWAGKKLMPNFKGFNKKKTVESEWESATFNGGIF